MRHYIIGAIVGLGLVGVLTAQTSVNTPTIQLKGTGGLVWDGATPPPQRVTINPQATFIVLHRTLDPMAVLCIERRSVELDALIGELPPRICRTIQEWVR